MKWFKCKLLVCYYDETLLHIKLTLNNSYCHLVSIMQDLRLNITLKVVDMHQREVLGRYMSTRQQLRSTWLLKICQMYYSLPCYNCSLFFIITRTLLNSFEGLRFLKLLTPCCEWGYLKAREKWIAKSLFVKSFPCPAPWIGHKFDICESCGTSDSEAQKCQCIYLLILWTVILMKKWSTIVWTLLFRSIWIY